jgi:hypothetical protein
MARMTPLDPDRFPMSEASDPDSVSLALETGRALWGQGEAREAVRWLRRAAQQADEAGNDLRALSLARAAADLTTLLELPLSVPPPPPPPAPGSPWDEFQDNTIVDAPTTVSKMVASAAVSAAVPPPPATTRSIATATVQSPVIQTPPSANPAVKPPAPRARAALRVAVSRGNASGGELAVTLLAEGQAAPAGSREALLVPLDPDTDLSAL